MKKIHPTYVPEDGLWYADLGDRELKAKSLKELSQKIKVFLNYASFTVVGYVSLGKGQSLNYREPKDPTPVRNSGGNMKRRQREQGLTEIDR